MGRRIYLSKGLIAGTLTADEEIEAKGNPVVMREVKYLQSIKTIKSKIGKKGAKNG